MLQRAGSEQKRQEVVLLRSAALTTAGGTAHVQMKWYHVQEGSVTAARRRDYALCLKSGQTTNGVTGGVTKMSAGRMRVQRDRQALANSGPAACRRRRQCIASNVASAGVPYAVARARHSLCRMKVVETNSGARRAAHSVVIGVTTRCAAMA